MPRLRIACLVLFGCGPSTAIPQEPDGNEGGGTTLPGGATATLSTDGSASQTGGATTEMPSDNGERFDLAQAPDLYLPRSCLLPLPSGGACERLPDPTMELGPIAADAALAVGAESIDLVAGNLGATDLDVLWSLTATMPCPTLLDGVPEGGLVNRFEIDALVGIWEFAKFRFSHRGDYAASLDVELLDDCVHVVLHDVRIKDPEYLEEWPVLPAVGILLAEPEGT